LFYRPFSATALLPAEMSPDTGRNNYRPDNVLTDNTATVECGWHHFAVSDVIVGARYVPQLFAMLCSAIFEPYLKFKSFFTYSLMFSNACSRAEVGIWRGIIRGSKLRPGQKHTVSDLI
jgi:hypothetical protein